MLTFFQLIGGILLLYIGAEALVRGGVGVALRLGVSQLVIGLTLISFGTSAPELVVSLNAAMTHDSAISLGNVMGSNIANLALVLGIAALIRPLRVEQQIIRLEMPVLLVATTLLVVLLRDDHLSRREGALLFAGLLAYTCFSVWLSRRHTTSAPTTALPQTPQRSHMVRHISLLLLGLALLIPGAHIFVQGAIRAAAWFGFSALVIGLTVVAVGTSLPEIATSAVAAWRGEGDLAVGNAVGSCIFNLFGILGITALFFGMDSSGVNPVDLGMMFATALLCLPIMRSGFVINRLEGALLLLGYAAYITSLILRT